MVVFKLPALLKVAVSPAPGAGAVLQLVSVAQVALVVPFHVALAANEEDDAAKVATMRAAEVARKAGLAFVFHMDFELGSRKSGF